MILAHIAYFEGARVPESLLACGGVASQILLLGTIFMVLGICTNTLYALLAGGAGGWLRGHRRLRARQRYVTGSVYIGLGLTTALASGPERH